MFRARARLRGMSKSYHQCGSTEDFFLYFLDCQLATVEGLERKKSTPKNALGRHRGIATKMIDSARAMEIDGVDQMGRVIAFEAKDTP